MSRTRDEQIFDARINQKQTWKQIGETHGISGTAARTAFERHMARIPGEDTARRRLIEAAKLDHQERMLAAAQTLALKTGDIRNVVAAAKTSIDITRLRAQLFGLNAPIRLQADIPPQTAAEEIETILSLYAAAGVNELEASLQ